MKYAAEGYKGLFLFPAMHPETILKRTTTYLTTHLKKAKRLDLEAKMTVVLLDDDLV